ncbi:MAG: DsrE family protein [Candidatus Thiosymbion ectosymbiont of Robbea hypermnestra]|nr:DsrE family protein [Candidatus Thiosymbion ectosymbiont of Robbea hypermnestra]
MRGLKQIGTIVALFCMVLSSGVFAADSGKRLFVNLTSDELNRATMALGFSTKILTQKKIPVTIFLNVEGVRIADKNITEHKHANGKSLKEMLATFLSEGGRVTICKMCMKNVAGMSEEDLVSGVEVGSCPDVTWPALSAEGTTVLSY